MTRSFLRSLVPNVHLYPYVLSIVPVLHLFSVNMDRLRPSSLWLPIVFSLLITFLSLQTSRLFCSSIAKRSLFTATLLTVFYTYGHIYSLLLSMAEASQGRVATLGALRFMAYTERYLHKPLLLSSLIFLLIGLLLIRHTSSSLATISRFLCIASFTLLSFSLLRMALFIATSPAVQRPLDAQHAGATSDGLEIKRDVYYIVLDGYARSDVLKQYYDYDNSVFDDYLVSRGFYIARDSYANYAWTFLSLPSSLNSEHLTYLEQSIGRHSRRLDVPFDLIRHNKVVRFYRSIGYRYVHVCSTWAATRSSPLADVEYEYRRRYLHDEFSRELASTTMLVAFDALFSESLAQLHRHAFAAIKNVATIEEPTFTFAHIMLPHYPHVFDRHGHVMTDTTRIGQFAKSRWDETGPYIEQLMFVNAQIREVIDEIIAESPVAPIIILQSDHGPQVPHISGREYARARLAILNAYYLPDDKSRHLYPSISPVNTFRLLSNAYHHTHLQLLEDSHYYSSFEEPFHFTAFSADGMHDP